MSGTRPERVLDPVCGMTVDVAEAEEVGLTVEHDGRTYAFCRSGCRGAFLEDPAAYAAVAGELRPAANPAGSGLPIIDDGMRRWYEACSCCLSEAYPEVKAALDVERAAMPPSPTQPGVGLGAAEQEVTTP